MNKVLTFIGLILLWGGVSAQELLFVEGVQLTLTEGTQVHVEGGVTWEENGMLVNQGDLYIGSNGSGYQPGMADWFQATAANSGNVPGFIGNVHMMGNMPLQRLYGPDSLGFSGLFLHTDTESSGILGVEHLNLDQAQLQLNRLPLHIHNETPAGIEFTDASGILGDTYVGIDGAYSKVIWHTGTSSAGQLFEIPYLTQESISIPMAFRLNQPSTDPVVTFTYPTNAMNEPYPIDLGTIQDVAHLKNARGVDYSPFFVDRYWYLDGGTNTFSGLSLSYDPEELTGELQDKNHLMRGQWWNGGKWVYFDLGDSISGNNVSWTSDLTLSGVWSLSMSQTPVSTVPELAVEEMNLFPNPSEGQVQLSISLRKAQQLIYVLFDVSGRLVWSKMDPSPSLYKTIEMDLKYLPSGIYELTIVGEGARASRRLMLY